MRARRSRRRTLAMDAAEEDTFARAGSDSTEVSMAVIEVKSFDSPDEVREFEANGRARVVEVAGQPVGYGTFEPGWTWSADVKPIAGTDSCQVSHLGYVLSGQMKIRMDDGSETTIGPGQVVAIPPGHDAEVVGDVACEMVDFGEFGHYAKR
jgi:hypothetical protein